MMNILIAEDEDDMAQIYLDILKPRGHEVIITKNGRDCVSKFLDHLYNKKKLSFDLVIIDHIMPKMTGADAARQILKEKPDQRIIFVSAYGSQLLGSLGDDFESIEFLTKPTSPSTLIDLIEKQVTV